MGLLGPGDLGSQLDHSLAFAGLVDARLAADPDVTGRVVDLGSGGGLPALVLLLAVSRLRALLLVEASGRRVGFLEEAAGRLAATTGGRTVEVEGRRAEEVGRDERRRGRADIVTARAFARPAATAECAAPLLRPGGTLVVSEPPDGLAEAIRWPADGLAVLGMSPAERVVRGSRFGFVLIEQARPCPERYPRRPGVPAKRPLFG